jgi:hypothetical protein
MEWLGIDWFDFGLASILLIIPAVVMLAIYFLPTGVALLRRKRNSLAIFILNFLAGWTAIGWIVAIVWSFMAEDRKG